MGRITTDTRWGMWIGSSPGWKWFSLRGPEYRTATKMFSEPPRRSEACVWAEGEGSVVRAEPLFAGDLIHTRFKISGLPEVEVLVVLGIESVTYNRSNPPRSQATSVGRPIFRIPGHVLWDDQLEALLTRHGQLKDCQHLIADWLRDRGMEIQADGVQGVTELSAVEYVRLLQSGTVNNHMRRHGFRF
jgi:hypothetical protein